MIFSYDRYIESGILGKSIVFLGLCMVSVAFTIEKMRNTF